MMKRALIFSVLVLTACGGGSSDRPTPRPPNRPEPKDDEILLLINGQPVTREEVKDSALDIDYGGTVKRYISWRLVYDRRKELGIQHAAPEREARAKVFVERLRQQLSEEEFQKRLALSKVDEADYTKFVAGSAELDELFAREKMAVYDVLREGYTRIDYMVFPSLAQADAYRAWHETAQRDKPPAEPAEKVTGIRVNRSCFPTWLPKTVLEEVMKAEFGSRLVSQTIAQTGGIFIIVRERRAGQEGSFEKLMRSVFDDVIAAPPEGHELDMWLQSLWLRAKIERRETRVMNP